MDLTGSTNVQSRRAYCKWYNWKYNACRYVFFFFTSRFVSRYSFSESDEHTFQPKASTWSDPSKAGGYGWGQLSHMFAGVYKVTKLNPKKYFVLSVPSPTGVDYTDAISVQFEEGATGAFSGCAYVPKGYGGGYNIRVHGDKGALFLDFEINRERLLVRTNDGKEINEEAKPGSGTHSYTTISNKYISRYLFR